MLQIPGQRPQAHDVWLPTTLEMVTADARTHIISESIILVAWGLLLRSYVGGGEVCFGYTATEHPYRKEESTLTPEKAVNMLICQMKVENSDSILNTLQTAEMHHKEALQYINHSLTSGELGLGSSNTSPSPFLLSFLALYTMAFLPFLSSTCGLGIQRPFFVIPLAFS